MAEELSYLMTTPYTLAKSRTGGVLSRLLSRIDLELIAAQIFTPEEPDVRKFAASMLHFDNPERPGSAKLLHDYVLSNMIPSDGRAHRVAIFLFRGEDACRKLSDTAGALYPEHRSIESLKGETIRDTYADLVYDSSGEVAYFEPAVFTPPTQDIADYNMKIFSDALEGISNLVDNIDYPDPDIIERTLVILKPDNWRVPSSRPGTILDMFSRTGLRVVGCKVYQMSVNEAIEFYSSVEEALIGKLGPKMGQKAVESLEREYRLHLDSDKSSHIAEIFGESYAREQFREIISFMTGRRPDKCPIEELDSPGKVKTMLVVYEGIGAVNKIREVLGPTDPTQAPGGTVRRDFGNDVMVNTAHASDSPESAEREFRVVKILENKLKSLIDTWLTGEIH